MPLGIGTPQVDGIANGDPNWGPKVKADIDALNGQFSLAAVNTYRPANSSALGSLSTMRTGDYAVQQDTGVTYRYNGSAWRAWESDWTNQVFTVTGVSGALNPTGGGNGWIFNYGQWRYTGGKVQVRFQFYLTGSTVAVTFQVSIALPVPSNVTGQRPLANGRLTHSSVDYWIDGTVLSSTFATSALSGAQVVPTNSSAPIAWSSGDILTLAYEYDPA